MSRSCKRAASDVTEIDLLSMSIELRQAQESIDALQRKVSTLLLEKQIPVSYSSRLAGENWRVAGSQPQESGARHEDPSDDGSGFSVSQAGWRGAVRLCCIREAQEARRPARSSCAPPR